MDKTKLATIDIRGKKYTTVDARVEFFREKFPTWSLETDFITLDLEHGVCVCRAIVRDENGKQVADGIAHEWQSKPGSMVNKTSYIENAQTSAIGRALGFIGIGINGMGIATADEVATKVAHDVANDPAPTVANPAPATRSIEQVVGDEIPFVEPTAPAQPRPAGPDDWLTVNAFQGIADKCSDMTELSRLLKQQRTNPKLPELVKVATARKQQILNELQENGGAQ